MKLQLILLVNTMQTSILKENFMWILDAKLYKEIVELKSGVKVYYVEDLSINTTTVDFKIEIDDLPSNNGMYHLLEHLVMNAENEVSRYTRQCFGEIQATTSCTSLNFTLSLHNDYIKKGIDLFFKYLKNTDFKKEMILHEIKQIDEEFWGKMGNVSPLYLFLGEYLVFTDDYSMDKSGNVKYYIEYFDKYLSKGLFLTKSGVNRFADLHFENMSDAYQQFLQYLMQKILENSQISIFVVTSLPKDQICEILDKQMFGKNNTKHNIIDSGITKFLKDELYIIRGKRNALSIVIKCPDTMSYQACIFFVNMIKHEAEYKIGINIQPYLYIIDGLTFISCEFPNYQCNDAFLLVLMVFLKDTNKHESVSDKMICEWYKAIASGDSKRIEKRMMSFRSVLHNLIIRKIIYDVKFDQRKIDNFYQTWSKMPHNNDISISESMSLIHNNSKKLEYAFRSKKITSEIDKFRAQLLDYLNYRTIITTKTDTSIYDVSKNKIVYDVFDLNVSQLIDKLKEQELPFPSAKNSQGVEIIHTNDTKNCLIFFFYFGISETDRVVFFIFSEILMYYINKTNDVLSKTSAFLFSYKSFRNVIVLYFGDHMNSFFKNVQYVIASLYIMVTNQAIVTDILLNMGKKQLVLELHETLEELGLSFQTATENFGKIEKILELIKTKCLYFGQDNNQFEELKQNISHLNLNLTDEQEFVLLPEFDVTLYSAPKKFNSEHIILHNKCCYNIQDLLDIKIAKQTFIFNVCAYFSLSNNENYWNRFVNYYIHDTGALVYEVTGLLSHVQIRNRVLDFKKSYLFWIKNLDCYTFKDLKKSIYRKLLGANHLDSYAAVCYLTKWGYLVRYSELKETIDKYFNVKLTLQHFKILVRRSIEDDLSFSFNKIVE